MLQEQMAKDSGIQSTWYGITCWKVYAQGLASGLGRHHALWRNVLDPPHCIFHHEGPLQLTRSLF